MRTLFSIIYFFILTALVSAQSNWNLLPSLSGTLNDIHFYNNQTGWAGGTNIYKTTNGGANWTLQLAEFASTIYFIDENTGFFAGNSGKKTTNGGANWFSIPVIVNVSDITFTDTLTGFAVGVLSPNGIIWKTTDAGLNWTQVFSQSTGGYRKVHFINPYTGWACGTGGVISKTTNAGTNWTGMNNNTYPYYDIWFVNENTGWTTFYSNSIRKSVNGGSSWQNQTLPNFGGYALHFLNELDGRVVGPGGYIMRTVNSGSNWFLETSPTTAQLNAIFFTGNDTGYICGNNGTILKTVNGGSITNIQNVSSEIPGDYSLSQNYPNPFNPVTKIKFDIPAQAFVKLIVYDVQGQEISTILSKELNAGTYSIDFDGSSLSSGVYFYKITSENYSVIKKMVLIK